MRSLLIAATASLLMATASMASDSEAQASPQNSGLDLGALDPSVAPGDDFFLYANGKWFRTAKIPADMSFVGADPDLHRQVEAQLRDMILASPATSQTRKLYTSFMDERRIEALDAQPLAADLARIADVASKRQFAVLLGETLSRFGSPLFSLEARPDPRRPDAMAFALEEDQFGLPDESYYVQPHFRPQLNAYRTLASREFAMIGSPRPEQSASILVGLETRMAVASLASVEGHDSSSQIECLSLGQLQAYAPGFPWAAFFQGAKLDPRATVVIDRDSPIRPLAKLFAHTPLSALKTWATFHLVFDASPYLSQRFVESRFRYARTLSGVEALEPRWRRGVTLVDSKLGDLLGRDYVDRSFPPSTKTQVDNLVANLTAAMAAHIEAADWAGPKTKAEALAKLAAMRIMVGHPGQWRDYGSLRIESDDLYGNAERSVAFDYADQTSSSGRSALLKWDTSAQSSDTYNDELENKIVIPAGILQPPFFDPSVDAAVNYGAIGAIIGHEIGHSFDDEGMTVDSRGIVHDWWLPAEARRFEARVKALSGQYDRFEPLRGAHVTGSATLSENIADLIGLEIALDAYHLSLHGAPAPIIDGLTGDQRFFIAFAQSFREKDRSAATREQLATDSHAPSRFRVIGAVRNSDAWYDAFHIPRTATYYLAPAERVHLW